MYSYDLAGAVATERATTLLAEAAVTRLVKQSRRGRAQPAAPRVGPRHGLFRRWGEATA